MSRLVFVYTRNWLAVRNVSQISVILGSLHLRCLQGFVSVSILLFCYSDFSFFFFFWSQLLRELKKKKKEWNTDLFSSIKFSMTHFQIIQTDSKRVITPSGILQDPIRYSFCLSLLLFTCWNGSHTRHVTSCRLWIVIRFVSLLFYLRSFLSNSSPVSHLRLQSMPKKNLNS